MHFTEQAPAVPISSFKRTKIIATVGPATDSYEKIRALIAAGVNGVRLNFSHGTNEDRDRQIPWIRKASAELGKPVAIIQDLQGPKVRLGDFDGMIEVTTGQHLTFEYQSKPDSGHIPMQYDLSKKVKPGERLYLFDGRVRTEITAVRNGIVYATAQNNGVLLKRKGMNLPDTDFDGDILTKKDMEDIHYGAQKDFDYVATSFIQTARDVENLRKILADLHHPGNKIISKIETKAAVDNIEAIVQASDAVMVARGDLAVETLPESVPVVQRQIIGLGLKYAKPTIVATQMLLSMTDMPEPTRAEVSDVATAVFVGADCVMLSDETAMGKYPIEAVQVMKRVILYAEQHSPLKAVFQIKREHDMQSAIAGSIISLANDIKATAIVAETKTGATALQVSSLRPDTALIAVTDSARTAQQLALVYDVKSYVRPAEEHAARKLTDWLQEHKVLKVNDVVVTVFGRYPGVVGTTDTIKVRILE
jgi:pyruvate kinase